MIEKAIKILQDQFGYSEFRSNQQSIIEHVLDGQDAFVLMPTGGGKSLCFQIPAIVRQGTGIIISPLIALMQDQVDTLKQVGVKAAYLNSSLVEYEAIEIENALVAGTLDLLYVAPERLLTNRFMQLLEKTQLALFAIDEAHCVSQWGHDFRPEYVELKILHERFPSIPRIALTATADEQTKNEIVHQLQLESAQTFTASFDRANIQYRIIPKVNAKEKLLSFIRTEHPDDAGIIYCMSRRKVEDLAQWLRDKGLNALAYHAGLDAYTRQRHQDRFIREEGIIMVATVAFGMGIDKPNVRFVAHLDLPKSMEGYYQETGRAGRDGLPATAWLAYGLGDLISLKQMLSQSQAPEQIKRIEQSKLQALLGFCETILCRRKVLLSYFGETYAKDCMNCDNCLTPASTWDGKIAAQKALSCVYRTGQRFGVNYLIDVLLGKSTEQINRFGHSQLSTYGIGKEYSQKQWHSIYRQLIAANLLTVDMEGYGGLHLTQKCQSILRGEETISFRQEPEKSAKSTKEKSRSNRQQKPLPSDELWHALKSKRFDLAKEQGVPPYVIFHDSTLQEIHEKKPTNLNEFATLFGVGKTKLEKFGPIFIDVIQAA